MQSSLPRRQPKRRFIQTLDVKKPDAKPAYTSHKAIVTDETSHFSEEL